MKASTLKSAAVKLSAVLLTVLLFAGSVSAAGRVEGKKKPNQNDIANLIAGIQSENYGVKRDCIYFSALYNVKETVKVLSNELENEKDPRICVLISLAIYKLTAPEGTNDSFDSALKDWKEKVHFLSNEIVSNLDDHKSKVATVDAK